MLCQVSSLLWSFPFGLEIWALLRADAESADRALQQALHTDRHLDARQLARPD